MIAGIDIGGTKTQILAEENGDKVGERHVLTTQWRSRTDHDSDARTLAALILETAGESMPTATVVGAHGCDSDEDRLALQARLAHLLPGAVLVLNDSELLLPASGRTNGISVISGTGSIAVSRDRQRRMIAAGGWGWYLGDEGSASGLVREAARSVRLSLDEGNPLDPLGQTFLDSLSVSSPIEIGRALAELGTAAGIGQFAPLVFEAAEGGSMIAGQVIANAGGSLSRLVEQLVARGAPQNAVVTGGGVITRQPRLLSAFRAALAQRLPDMELTLLKEPPVLGAIALARKLDAGALPEDLPLPHVGGALKAENDGRAA